MKLRSVLLPWAGLGIVLMIGPSAAGWQYGDDSHADTWGGPNIRVQMNEQGGTVEFSCAHGTILEPVKPDASGLFSVAGTYTPEHGGPIRKDETANDLPATYKGRVSGDSMHLEVILPDKTMQPPPFTFTRGGGGKLIKCR